RPDPHLRRHPARQGSPSRSRRLCDAVELQPIRSSRSRQDGDYARRRPGALSHGREGPQAQVMRYLPSAHASRPLATRMVVQVRDCRMQGKAGPRERARAGSRASNRASRLPVVASLSRLSKRPAAIRCMSEVSSLRLKVNGRRLQMRVLILAKEDHVATAPTPEMMAEFQAFNEKLVKAGVVIGDGRLYPSGQAKRLK